MQIYLSVRLAEGQNLSSPEAPPNVSYATEDKERTPPSRATELQRCYESPPAADGSRLEAHRRWRRV